MILRERWNGAAPTDIDPARLATRFEAAAAESSHAGGANDPRPFRETLLELELLAGLAPPAGDREQWRQLQVARLSARLRGDAAATTAVELADLLARWTTLGVAPDADFDARLERGLAAVLETLP
ncbi:MAG: hypothetical protein ACHP7D_10965 [Lysobacterales bacterium]